MIKMELFTLNINNISEGFRFDKYIEINTDINKPGLTLVPIKHSHENIEDVLVYSIEQLDYISVQPVNDNCRWVFPSDYIIGVLALIEGSLKLRFAVYNELEIVTVYDNGSLKNFYKWDSYIKYFSKDLFDEPIIEINDILPSKGKNTILNKKLCSKEFLNNYALSTKAFFPIRLNSGYNAELDNPVFKQVSDLYSLNKKNKILPINKWGVMLKTIANGCSLGIEYEVCNGSVPTCLYSILGIIPVRDGSVNRNYYPEYPTFPMKDEVDFSTIYNQCYILQNTSEIDYTCSTHIHIGNTNFTKKEFVAYFILCLRLQDEMFRLVHPYKNNEIASLGKQKNYSAPISGFDLESWKESLNLNKNIEKIYDEIYNFYRIVPESKSKLLPWSAKWECPTRYYWLNMVPYFWGQNTIENRLMTPTLGFGRIFYWIVLNLSLVNYAKDFCDSILSFNTNIKIKDILRYFQTKYENNIDIKNVYTKALMATTELNKDHVECYKEVNRKCIGSTRKILEEIGNHAINTLQSDNYNKWYNNIF